MIYQPLTLDYRSNYLQIWLTEQLIFSIGRISNIELGVFLKFVNYFTAFIYT